ncbi:hypothetical protein QP938_03865 [Porticoccaceae bacterium LTM1]|nr:hypothetical protein QP938_03865 [Porticoccaceae bacterium LTM1]
MATVHASAGGVGHFVILSTAKDLRFGQSEILRSVAAQDDKEEQITAMGMDSRFRGNDEKPGMTLIPKQNQCWSGKGN